MKTKAFQHIRSIKIGLFIAILPLAENLHFFFSIQVCISHRQCHYFVLYYLYVHKITYISIQTKTLLFAFERRNSSIWLHISNIPQNFQRKNTGTTVGVLTCSRSFCMHFSKRVPRKLITRKWNIYTNVFYFCELMKLRGMGWANTQDRTFMVANGDARLLYMPLWCWFKFHLSFSLFIRLHKVMREQIQLFTVNGLKIAIWLKSTTDLEQILYYHNRYYSQKPLVLSFFPTRKFAA